jgi:glycosyltransferase involved in cell wall biosynthesis
MKVLHLINTLSAGGAELHLLTLCRHLALQGVEPVVACLREQVKGSRSLRADFESAGIRVVNLHADHRYDLRFIPAVAGLIRRERPALLHTHLPRADLVGAFRRFFDLPVPWVCSVHDIHDQSWAGKWTLPLFNRIWRKPDRVVAISYAVKDWLIRTRGVPGEKVRVIHYGIEPEKFAGSQGKLRGAIGCNGGFVVGTIGRLEARKGHDCLIRAMANLTPDFPDSSLVIAGHDPWNYGTTLQALIDELNLESKVQLVGFQSDIPAYLGALDVFAFASRAEGFGQVVTEAMAAGKPVVVSKVAPLTEIVIDGENGLLADPANPGDFARAIAKLLTHPEAARQMGRRAQEHVDRRFSAQRMSAQTAAVYQELVG